MKLLLKERSFFNRYLNNSVDVKNQFETKTVNREEIIIDNKTGLMWQSSGSLKFVSLKGAEPGSLFFSAVLIRSTQKLI